MINGNITGLSKQVLSRLELLEELAIEREFFASEELVEELCDLTTIINREISVYLNRRGELMDTTVGEIGQVSLPSMTLRRSDTRLSGIRCIHTHPGGKGTLSGVDLQALSKLRFDAMAAIGVRGGKFTDGYIAMLNPSDEYEEYEIFGPLLLEEFCGDDFIREIRRRDPLVGIEHSTQTHENIEERAVLVGLNNQGGGTGSIDELEDLARTADARVVHKELQNRNAPDPATYIGRGKAGELTLICKKINANLVIADDELSASQIKNLEEILGIKVIDRTSLILDIFADRAVSSEGKLQVELAQLKYRLPRLRGLGVVLSRLGGGIGTRGPGEKKLETDRRHIHRRINEIEKDLSKVKIRRTALREKRTRDGQVVCALVGYTNTGKSTLLNALSGSSMFTEDKLFATLDPVSRGIILPDGRKILLTDTVGFIDKLPHDLVDAFQSTLEEVVEADLLLHVVDAGSADLIEHMEIVDQVLNDLGANQTLITVYNKMDTVVDTNLLPIKKPQACISALKDEGLDELVALIQEHLPYKLSKLNVLIPYEKGSLVAMIHDEGNVLNEEYVNAGVEIEAEVDKLLYSKIEAYIVGV
ncbi:MAG TPA: GTPase HflX [Bacillota bacterium]|nr:GTPase HflX [Bacillota bacterium]